MRERKYVKFKTDMYDDTKFKIIDTKPARDLIHYVWTRLVTLAGKVNLEGDLYLSKNTPYTIETLAIEFNRGGDEVKSALEVLIELEMIQCSKENVYRVINFAKHQNIKVKEKVKAEHKKEKLENKENKVQENIKDEIHDCKTCNDDKDKNFKNKANQNKVEDIKNHGESDLEAVHKDINKADDNIISDKINSIVKNNINLMPLDIGENKKVNTDEKESSHSDIVVTDGEFEYGEIYGFTDGDLKPLGKNERIVTKWSF